MAFQIGQCCTDQIIPPPSGGGSGSSSGLNEIIPFDNVATVTIQWNAARKARFGDAAVIYIEILGEDGKYRNSAVEVVPDVAVNTTQYVADLGGLATGRVVIT